MATDRHATAAAGRHLRAVLERGAVGAMTDADLLARFVASARPAGDRDAAESAFAALVERHGGPVLRATRAILGDEAAGLDAAQATFLVLARKAPTLRVRDSLAPWLGAVARRVARGARRERARRRRHEQAAAAARPEAAGPPPVDPDRADVARILLAEVDRLPEPFRSAVVACHLDGLSQRDAADRLGWPVGTLQSRLDRGRRKLRDRLARRGLAPAVLPALAAPRVPEAFALATGRAAASVALTGSALGLAAPGALALIPSPWHGGLMAHLKLGSIVATAALALGGSAWTLAPGRPGESGNAPRVAAAPDPARAATPGLPEAFDLAFPVSAPAAAAPADATKDGTPGGPAETIPDPVVVAGPDASRLLCFKFRDGQPALGLPEPPVGELTFRNYPVHIMDLRKDAEVARRYGVTDIPSYVALDADGQFRSRLHGVATARQLAEFFNSNRAHLTDAPMGIEEVPAPALKATLPTLLYFRADWCGPCRETDPRLDRLAAQGYPVRKVDIDAAADVAKQYEVKAVPTFVLVDRSGAEVARGSGLMTARQLAALFDRHRVEPDSQVANAASPPPGDEPELYRIDERAQPWDSALRVKVHLTNEEWGFGSGVVIASGPAESLALTAAHLFKDRAGSIEGFLAMSPMPPISVDRFGGDPARSGAAVVPCIQKDKPAELIALDPAADVALIRFRPGQVVPAARFDGSALATGAMLTTVGCSHGHDASAWSTNVLNPQVRMVATEHQKKPRSFVSCTNAPKQGRGGGGLFDRSRALVGICASSDPNSNTGLYAGPESVGRFLRNFAQEGGQIQTPVRFVATIDPDIRIAGHDVLPTGGAAQTAAEQARRLDELERKLDRLIEKMDNMRGEVRTDLPERPSAIPKR